MRATFSKFLPYLVGLVVFCGGTALPAAADSPASFAIVVATNSPLTNLSLYDLKHLYMGEFVTGPDGKRLSEGHMKVRESQDVTFTPDRDGTYLLLVQSGQNSHSLAVTTGQCYAYLATDKHKFIVNLKYDFGFIA